MYVHTYLLFLDILEVDVDGFESEVGFGGVFGRRRLLANLALDFLVMRGERGRERGRERRRGGGEERGREGGSEGRGMREGKWVGKFCRGKGREGESKI